MRITKRVLRYAEEHFGEVHHTTLNPEGPGVVRIHLVPPKIKDGEVGASVAIVNGQFIVPVNVSWSILLTELIEQVNVYSGREISEDDLKSIIRKTCKSVSKVYPWVGKWRFPCQRGVNLPCQLWLPFRRDSPDHSRERTRTALC